MAKRVLRKTLSAPGLLRVVRACFDEVNDPVSGRRFSLSDCLMSGLAVFGLKYPSLLQFDRGARTNEVVRVNLKRLYGIERAPCDTALRERLDAVDPRALRGVFKRVFAQLQRGKGLEGFTWLGGHYLLSVDGTGYFSSSSVHCENCCEKHHRDGRVTYSHQMLGAVVVHPEQREVFPLAPEPIVKGDGARKNDCERNAAKRLLEDVRREHPHLKLIVVEDGLASNGPHINLLKSLDMRFILGAKPADHKALFEWVQATERMNTGAVKYVEHTDEHGVHHRFRYLNDVPLNDTHFELEVNFLEYWETRPDGKAQHFSWVTDLPIDDAHVMALMRGARARWRIENETFNTLSWSWERRPAFSATPARRSFAPTSATPRAERGRPSCELSGNRQAESPPGRMHSSMRVSSVSLALNARSATVSSERSSSPATFPLRCTLSTSIGPPVPPPFRKCLQMASVKMSSSSMACSSNPHRHRHSSRLDFLPRRDGDAPTTGRVTVTRGARRGAERAQDPVADRACAAAHCLAEADELAFAAFASVLRTCRTLVHDARETRWRLQDDAKYLRVFQTRAGPRCVHARMTSGAVEDGEVHGSIHRFSLARDTACVFGVTTPHASRCRDEARPRCVWSGLVSSRLPVECEPGLTVAHLHPPSHGCERG